MYIYITQRLWLVNRQESRQGLETKTDGLTVTYYMEVCGQFASTDCFTLGERFPGSQWIGDWGGGVPQPSSPQWAVKSSSHMESDSSSLRNFQHGVHKNQINPVHTLIHYFCKIHSNVSDSSTPRFCK
jgi:hypothetical protein